MHDGDSLINRMFKANNSDDVAQYGGKKIAINKYLRVPSRLVMGRLFDNLVT
jgi:hypothetical protein